MAKRRIPAWVVMVAFGMFAGGAIAALAYVRARTAKAPAMFCLQRTPSGEVLRRSKVPLVEHGSRRRRGACELEYRQRVVDGPLGLQIVSRRMPWTSRLAEVGRTARAGAVAFAHGSYVTLDHELVMVMPGIEGESIEIHVAHDTFDDPFPIADDIVRRIR